MPPTFSLSTGVVSHVRMLASQTTAEPNTASTPANYSSPESGLEMSTEAASMEFSPSPAPGHIPAHETGGPPEQAFSGDGSGSRRNARLSWKAYLTGQMQSPASTELGFVLNQCGAVCEGSEITNRHSSIGSSGYSMLFVSVEDFGGDSYSIASASSTMLARDNSSS